jgi:hypothetical protein
MSSPAETLNLPIEYQDIASAVILKRLIRKLIGIDDAQPTVVQVNPLLSPMRLCIWTTVSQLRQYRRIRKGTLLGAVMSC